MHRWLAHLTYSWLCPCPGHPAKINSCNLQNVHTGVNMLCEDSCPLPHLDLLGG